MKRLFVDFVMVFISILFFYTTACAQEVATPSPITDTNVEQSVDNPVNEIVETSVSESTDVEAILLELQRFESIVVIMFCIIIVYLWFHNSLKGVVRHDIDIL